MFLPQTIRTVVVSAIGMLCCCAGCRHTPPAATTQPILTPLSRFDYVQYRMGMPARLTLYAKDRDAADIAARAAYHRVTELDEMASDYKKNSELMKLCARAGGPPVKVSDELFHLLQKSNELAERSHGAFDCTAGPLIQLWRQARKTGQLPTQQQIDAAMQLVGWKKMKLDPADKTVQLAVPGMRLDLGGIAKGYAGDVVASTLRENGVSSALWEMGGDIVVSDPPPDNSAGWRIEIMPTEGSTTHRSVTIHNCGISTSGDTEQYVIIGGKRYSHIVDPRTGWALTNRIWVTIIAPKGTESDGLSTACSVLEPHEAEALVKSFAGAKIYVRKMTD